MDLSTDPIVRAGDRFRSVRPMPVEGLVHWRAPLTTGFSGTLPAGSVVTAVNDVPSGRHAFQATPERYAEIEALLVPSEDREDPHYDGYHLVLPIAAVGSDLEWILGADQSS
jgi:hypothetical protein